MSKSILYKLFMSAALAGLLASPAFGADPSAPDDDLLFVGLFGLAAGAQDASETDPDIDLSEGTRLTLSAEAYVNIPFNNAFSAQLDLQSEYYDRADNGEDNPQGAHMLGGHLSLRDPGLGLIGIFGGAGAGMNNDSGAGGQGIGYLVGLEAQLYLDSFTFYAQGGYGDFSVDDADPDDEGFTNGWFARGVARYFLTEDIMVQAEASYGETGSYVDGVDGGEIWNWGVEGKRRLSESMPIYGTLEYRGGAYGSDDDTEAGEEHAVLAGLNFAIGASSLLDNDRRGATLDTPMLPARASAWTEAID